MPICLLSFLYVTFLLRGKQVESQCHLECDDFPQLQHHGQKVVLHVNLPACVHTQEPITADSSEGSLNLENILPTKQ